MVATSSDPLLLNWEKLSGKHDKRRDKFIATGHGLFNLGGIFEPGAILPPSASPDGQDGVVVIFNMAPAKPTAGWNQIMSLPGRLSLLGKNDLKIEPAGDLASLRYNHQQVGPMTLPPNQEIVLDKIKRNTMEIIAEIDPKNTATVELKVLRSPNNEEYTRIAFFKQRGQRDWDRYSGWQRKEWIEAKASLITLESALSSILPNVLSRPPEIGPFHLEPGQPLKLRIFRPNYLEKGEMGGD